MTKHSDAIDWNFVQMLLDGYGGPTAKFYAAIEPFGWTGIFRRLTTCKGCGRWIIGDPGVVVLKGTFCPVLTGCKEPLKSMGGRAPSRAWATDTDADGSWSNIVRCLEN